MLTYTYMICPRSQPQVILKHGEGKIDEILNCDFTSTFTADGLYKIIIKTDDDNDDDMMMKSRKKLIQKQP